MGLRHARAFASLPKRFETVGAYDLREDVAVPEYTRRLRSEEEAIALADVLIVATPTSAHSGVVARALAAGRHVLVEKPLCATAAEARAIASLTARGGGRLFVGHSERFNPVVRVLARLLRGDSIVSVDLLRVGPSRAEGGGVLVNLGVHDLDLAVYLGGAPLSLRAAVGTRAAGSAGEDLAHVLFTTGGGAAGHLCVDRTAPAKRRELVVATAGWLYEGDLLRHALVRTALARGRERVLAASWPAGAVAAVRTDVPLPLGEPLASQALALADALDAHGGHAHGPLDRPKRTPREIATGEDGAYAVSLAERAASLLSSDPFESPAREKLVAGEAPLLPRE